MCLISCPTWISDTSPEPSTRLAVKAILEGAKMTVEDGLKCEAKCFGQCWTTEDNRIGLKNFVEKGARSKAPFVHR